MFQPDLSRGVFRKAPFQGDRSHMGREALCLLALLLAGTVVASVSIGASAVSLGTLGQWFLGLVSGQPAGLSTGDSIILFRIRLPRMVMGGLVGASLAVAGACLQGLFRNPLADPGVIGISGGAAFGAVLSIVLGGTVLAPLAAILGDYLLPASAFVGGLATTLLLFAIGTRDGQTSVATMLLAGIALAAIAGAGVGFLVYMADDQQLRDLTFWTMGGLGGATWSKVALSGPFMLVSLVVMMVHARGLNALLLGDHQALHMGVDVQALKSRLVLFIALSVGAAVSVSGIIGFVGIIVPHLLRLIIGPDHRFLLPASAVLGAILLMLTDILARTIDAPAEMPIGIVMSAIGGPFFLWLMLRKRRALSL